MKVVHINTYEGNGGAGRACLRLSDALQVKNIDSKVLVYYQFKESSTTECFSKSLIQKAFAIINILLDRYISKFAIKAVKIPFSIQWFGTNITNHPSVRAADIIHLHWVNHGYLSPRSIAKLHKLNKPIVWTFHDSNPITGGCHVRYTCHGYLNNCGNCPVLKFSYEKDFSHMTWKAKKKAYSKLNFDIIAPSNWMKKNANHASLTKGLKAHMIPNALETDIFKPVHKKECRNDLGIDQDTMVILSGYMPSSTDKHKGFEQLIDTLNHLSVSPHINKDKLLLYFYGSEGDGFDLNIPIKHKFAGKIDNDDLLVKIYNASDVFLFPSLEESMGYTALESLSCGTPVVGFNTSGVPDVVLHKKNGYLASLYDTQDLANGLIWILNNPNKDLLASNAREWAVSKFSLEVVAQQHINLYKNLIDHRE